jgi:hypothetical protein
VQNGRAWEEVIRVSLMDSQKADLVAHAHGFYVHLRLGAGQRLAGQIGPSQGWLDERRALHLR